MPPSLSEVRSLLEQPHSTKQAAPLESYLQCMRDGSVDYYPDAVRVLLKVYRLFGISNETAVYSAFLVALRALPEHPTNFQTFSYLAKPPKELKIARDAWKKCQFASFWQVVASFQDEKSVVAWQQGILHILATTHRTAELAVVLEALQTKQVPSSPFVEKVGDVVTFVASEYNTSQNNVANDAGDVDFAAIQALMHKVMAAE